ncbi:hypothetical protein [Halobaculum limi]|uniref:hypothetical protein n=1 Tax=Halobaculum limi TaxID=3031916 RepID=UPI002405889A|nr:hypothetical protein [Halobaculum sp. YSMS11]
MSKTRVLSVFVIISVVSMVGALLIVGIASAQETQTPTPAPTSTPAENTNANNSDTDSGPTVLHTIDHVTIHNIDWREDSVAISLSAQKPDTITVTDYAGDRYYWQDYEIEQGRQTIVHEYRGDAGHVSFGVKSAREGIELSENTRFVMPGANEIATLLMGVTVSFVLVAAFKLRRDRKREKGAKRVF